MVAPPIMPVQEDKLAAVRFRVSILGKLVVQVRWSLRRPRAYPRGAGRKTAYDYAGIGEWRDARPGEELAIKAFMRTPASLTMDA